MRFQKWPVTLLLLTAGVAVVSPMVPQGMRAESGSLNAGKPDTWAGTFLKFGRYQTERSGQFHEAPRLTLTRAGDHYVLGKPYDWAKFRENSDGVLEDGKGGLGKIIFGKVEFADGRRARVLRADFCYEDFLLFETGNGEP